MALNPQHVAMTIAALFVILFLLERAFPLRAMRSDLWRHLLVNAAMSALALGAALLLVRPAATTVAQDAERWRFGLLQWFELPALPALIVALLWFDLTFHWWHFANHRVALLWRFHIVHHIDPHLDVSTAFRFHFGEVALSAVFRVVQIALIGAPFTAIVTYELLFQANTLFHHSNVRLPWRIERLLSWVLVTPRMHGIHHSMVQAENGSNFSVVFSFWDRVRRTMRLNVPQRAIDIGIPAYPFPADNTIGRLSMLPFKRQRDPWLRPDGSVVSRTSSTAMASTVLAP